MSKIDIKNKDIEEVIFHYPRYFDRPLEVVQEKALSKTDKIRLLKGWKQDIKLEEVAEEESMHSSRPDILDEIEQALGMLNSG